MKILPALFVVVCMMMLVGCAEHAGYGGSSYNHAYPYDAYYGYGYGHYSQRTIIQRNYFKNRPSVYHHSELKHKSAAKHRARRSLQQGAHRLGKSEFRSRGQRTFGHRNNIRGNRSCAGRVC